MYLTLTIMMMMMMMMMIMRMFIVKIAIRIHQASLASLLSLRSLPSLLHYHCYPKVAECFALPRACESSSMKIRGTILEVRKLRLLLDQMLIGHQRDGVSIVDVEIVAITATIDVDPLTVDADY
uniref:Uncharacterized protein n=1 Tax=Glossina pallidipes TaxID=7398 RepID=A0A1B0A5K4_GLOPL